MSKQAIFDQMARHMLHQGTRSIDINGEPVLVGVNGNKDPLGALIPQSAYTPDMEKLSAAETFAMVGVVHSEDTNLLVDQVRQVHDFHSPEEWEYWLKQVAKLENLRWNQ